SQDLRETILAVHNKHRKYHHAPDLGWDNGLASYAQTWVNKCVFQHSGGPYGENIYAIMPGPTGSWTDATINGLNAWVYEVKNYDYNKPGFAENTGHFTQFVWKSTSKVGCAWNNVACSGQAIFMCEYSTPGNYAGEYQKNVL
ncbi:PR-1-like protein, partial [Rhizodiscina lignyota]